VAAIELLGLAWERPWGVLALLVPALVWLLAARGGRSVDVWTGTLAVWREVAGPTPQRERRARRLPLAVRFLLAALVIGTLALVEPRAPSPAASRTWTVVVDRSPSMYLPWLAADGKSQRQLTRLEHAAEQARELLAQVRSEGDRVVWLTYEDGRPARIEGGALPQAWLTASAIPQSEPPWPSHARTGTLWVSDAEPAAAARDAGLALSGGAAVPGFVAALGSTRVEWDGEQLRERADAGAQPVVLLAPGAEGPVERVVRAWAQARGCEVAAQPGASPVLAVVVDGGARSTRRGSGSMSWAGRDGWRWEVGLADAFHPRGEVWLREDEFGLPVVAWEPGRVTLASGLYDREPAGDPADFALSWSALLDRAGLAPAGVVPLAERRAAGAGRVRAPLPPSTESTSPGGLPAAALAGSAAALALAALLTRRR